MKKYKFSQSSISNLEECDEDLQRLFKNVLNKQLTDISVIEGSRDKQLQNYYYDTGKSKVRWPKSKHNIGLGIRLKSDAIDVCPCINGKLSWTYYHCIYLAGIVMSTAKELGIDVIWGGNWDNDGEIMTDQDFHDLLHYQLIR